MADKTNPPEQPDGGAAVPAPARSVADELQKESERLRLLAEELKAREAEMAEMRENYPHFKKAVYALLREKFERELPPLPDKDLEAFAKDEGALPLEAFIDDLERASEAS